MRELTLIFEMIKTHAFLAQKMELKSKRILNPSKIYKLIATNLFPTFSTIEY